MRGASPAITLQAGDYSKVLGLFRRLTSTAVREWAEAHRPRGGPPALAEPIVKFTCRRHKQ